MAVGVEQLDQVVVPRVKGRLAPQQATALVLQLIIVAMDPVDNDALRYLARFFTPQDYDDLVDERTLMSRCGYPTCPKMLRDSSGEVRNPLSRTVIAWQHNFCTLPCYQASSFYRQQLGAESLITRDDVAIVPFGDMHWEQDILLLPEVESIAKMRKKTVSETVADLLRQQKQLTTGMQNLDITHPEPSQPTDASVTSLVIKERET